MLGDSVVTLVDSTRDVKTSPVTGSTSLRVTIRHEACRILWLYAKASCQTFAALSSSPVELTDLTVTLGQAAA